MRQASLQPELASDAAAETETQAALPALAPSWAEFLATAGAGVLEPALLDWLPRQRWFGAKTRSIESVHASSWVELARDGAAGLADFAASETQAGALSPALFFFDVTYFSGPPDRYQIPLAIGAGGDLDAVMAEHPESIIAKMTTAAGTAAVYDATVREDFHQELLRLIAGNATLPVAEAGALATGALAAESAAAMPAAGPADGAAAVQAPAGAGVPAPAPLSAQPGEAAAPPRTDAPSTQSAGGQRLQPRESPSAGDVLPEGGRLDARASKAFPVELAAQRLASRVSSTEQSNTSIRLDDKLFLKLFRRLQAEENPDVEVGRFLTEIASFPRIPPFFGEIAMSSPGSQKTTVAMLQGLVPNQGDGWQWFLDELSLWLVTVADQPAPAVSQTPQFQGSGETPPENWAGAQSTLQAAALLGRRTAEMHLALASSADLPAFAPEPMTAEDLARDAERIEAQLKSTLEALKLKLATLDDATTDAAGLLLSRRPELIRRARSIAALEPSGQRIRIHGDYHLGQTLRTDRCEIAGRRR